MKVDFKKPFLKEVKSLKDKNLKDAIADCIFQVESSEKIAGIKNLKKLAGFDTYYRIRIGNYRIGIKLENNVVYFLAFEHRKDIYKNLP